MQYRFTLPLRYVIVVALLASACSSGSTQLVGPAAPKCQATVSGVPTSVPAEGAQVKVSVSAARECGWTASSEASWAVVSPSAGQGAGTLTVRVSPNGAAAPRSGAIVVNDARVGLKQEPAPCRHSLSSTSVTVPHTGGRVSVSVEAPSGCAWTASSAAWIEVATGSGSGAGTAEFVVAPNFGAARSATLTVAGRPWRVDQAGAPAAPPPPDPAPPPAPPPPAPPPPPPAPEEIRLSGRVDDVRGSCPNLEFRLERRSVETDAATSFRSGNCRHVNDGRYVRVTGELRGRRIYATIVEIGRDDD
ncbi:MAG TPA: BACON domain-containing protein [Vicinamibacterales bacterium]|nr:BACON domain-containing protein [Acidobacteriota bacterium]HOC18854.1 BACON domain-containing protein [Vicinamibacterales bacterium]